MSSQGRWREASDSTSGRPYFYHTKTKEVRWSLPDFETSSTGDSGLQAPVTGGILATEVQRSDGDT